MLKPDTPPEQLPARRARAKSRVFSTDNSTDMLDYNAVLTMAQGGAATGIKEETMSQPDKGRWLIFMVWAEHYYIFEDSEPADTGNKQ
jgi:hypothetical protein